MDEYIGTIKMFAGERPPENWLICDGRMVKKDDYPELYKVIRRRFGKGPGVFGLPDLRGRSPVCLDNTNRSLRNNIGDIGGNEPEIIPTELVKISTPGNTDTGNGAVKLRVISEDVSVSGMLPYLAINFIIVAKGYYHNDYN